MKTILLLGVFLANSPPEKVEQCQAVCQSLAMDVGDSLGWRESQDASCSCWDPVYKTFLLIEPGTSEVF